jgi:hypothetical protein
VDLIIDSLIVLISYCYIWGITVLEPGINADSSGGGEARLGVAVI